MTNIGRRVFNRITALALPLRGILSAKEYYALRAMPGHTSGTVRLFGADFQFTDPGSLLVTLSEIFCDEIYKFPTRKQRPYIIDAGANIGVSILYLKRLYPDCRIVAFEPDKNIFEVLKANVESRGLSNVELRQSCAWVADTDLQFYSEGALSGSIQVDYTGKNNQYTVKAERLHSYIEREEVDLLKLDIEGAEREVLFDLLPSLHNVANLFVEYHGTPDRDQNLGAMLDAISAAGFRYYISNPMEDVAHPLCNRCQGSYDLQLNIFAFRP